MARTSVRPVFILKLLGMGMKFQINWKLRMFVWQCLIMYQRIVCLEYWNAFGNNFCKTCIHCKVVGDRNEISNSLKTENICLTVSYHVSEKCIFGILKFICLNRLKGCFVYKYWKLTWVSCFSVRRVTIELIHHFAIALIQKSTNIECQMMYTSE